MVVFKRRLWAANIACIVHRPFKEAISEGELKGLLANEINKSNQEGLSWRNLDKIRPTNAYFWRWLWIAAEVVWWLSCSTRLHKQEGQLECPWRQQVESRTASRKPSQSMVSNREPRLSHDTWGNSLHSVLYLSNSCVHSFKYICLLSFYGRCGLQKCVTWCLQSSGRDRYAHKWCQLRAIVLFSFFPPFGFLAGKLKY
jgi:hypothetical protein